MAGVARCVYIPPPTMATWKFFLVGMAADVLRWKFQYGWYLAIDPGCGVDCWCCRWGGGEGYVVIYLGMRGYERNCFTSVQCSNLCGMRTILAYIAPTCMYATQGITRTLPDRE